MATNVARQTFYSRFVVRGIFLYQLFPLCSRGCIESRQKQQQPRSNREKRKARGLYSFRWGKLTSVPCRFRKHTQPRPLQVAFEQPDAVSSGLNTVENTVDFFRAASLNNDHAKNSLALSASRHFYHYESANNILSRLVIVNRRILIDTPLDARFNATFNLIELFSSFLLNFILSRDVFD